MCGGRGVETMSSTKFDKIKPVPVGQLAVPMTS